jgi:hypothetical protein
VNLVATEEPVGLAVRAGDILRRQDLDEAGAVLPLDDVGLDAQQVVDGAIRLKEPLGEREVVAGLPWSFATR